MRDLVEKSLSSQHVEIAGREKRQRVAHYNRGLILAASGQHQRACTEFQCAINSRPNMAVAHAALGISLYHLNLLSESAKALKAATIFDSGNPELHHKLGVVLYEAGQFADAAREFEQAAHHGSNQSSRMLARCYYECGKPHQAMNEILLRVSNADQFNKESVYDLAFYALRSKNYDAAVRYGELALGFDPSDHAARSLLTNVYRAAGEPSHAFSRFRGLKDQLEAAPAGTYIAIADCLRNAGQEESAVSCLLRGIAANIDDDTNILALGGELNRLGRQSEAISTCKQILNGNPSSLGSLVLAAKSFLQLKKNREAVEFLDKAGLPPNKALLIEIGDCFAEMQDYVKACAAYEAHRELGSDKAVYGKLGYCLLCVKDFERAKDVYQRDIKARGASARSFNNLASAWAGLGSFARAEKALEAAIRIEPSRHDLYLNKARLLLQFKQFDSFGVFLRETNRINQPLALDIADLALSELRWQAPAPQDEKTLPHTPMSDAPNVGKIIRKPESGREQLDREEIENAAKEMADRLKIDAGEVPAFVDAVSAAARTAMTSRVAATETTRRTKAVKKARPELTIARLKAAYDILLRESDLANPSLPEDDRMRRAIHLHKTYYRLRRRDPNFHDESEQLRLARNLLNSRAYQRRKAANLAVALA
jgi:tetratricopeptide (TPR) repeat protein